jgi:hypothetical protein
MNVHLLTPFSRPDNLPRLLVLLGPQRIIWHPITGPDLRIPTYRWVQPHQLSAPVPLEQDPAYWKLNRWIESQEIINDDWYGFLNDDDGLEDNVADMLRQQSSQSVIIISMRRGMRCPARVAGFRHDTSTLLAGPENMHVNSVGLEQMFVKGDVLRHLRFTNWSGADGQLIEHVVVTFPTQYMPDYYALFNLLEPGRWDHK